MADYGEPDYNVYTSTGEQVEATFNGLPVVLAAIERIKMYPRNVVSIELRVIMSDVKVFGEPVDGLIGEGTQEP